jgi:hypothetical protein
MACIVQVDSTKYTKASARQNVHVVPVPHFVPYEVHINNDIRNITHKTKKSSNTNPTKNRG